MRRSVAAGVLALAVFASPAGWADSLITMKSRTERVGAGDVAPREETWEMWLGDGKLRQDREGMSFIVNREKSRLFIVMHAEKKYHELDLPLDLSKQVPEEKKERFQQIAAQMEMEVQITPTDDAKEISGHKARLYKVTTSNAMGMRQEIDLWMTKDLGIDISVLKDLTSEVISAQPMGAEWMKKILAIEGYPVLHDATVSMAGVEMKSREELVSIEEKEAPAGNYEPPPGYVAEPFDFAAGL